MEKGPTNTENNVDLERFNSKNPFIVLGVSTKASLEEINIARKKLLQRFHPDLNKSPNAIKISQNINNAYDLIIKLRSNGKNYQEAEEYRFSENEFESDFFDALDSDVDSLEIYLKRARDGGIKEDKIKELINSEKAKIIIEEKFAARIKPCLWSKRVADILDYIKEWKHIGIDTAYVFESAKIREIFTEHSFYLIESDANSEGSKTFPEFVKLWKKIGIDLNNILHQAKSIDLLADGIF